MTQERLSVIPITLEVANQGVRRWHRHHRPVLGAKWALGCVTTDQELHGVAIAGRPVARMLDDGTTCEVTRVAADGTANVCSCLYGAMRRVARAMGYSRIVTYTLEVEPGTSLQAAGWARVLISPGGSWSCVSRPREDKHPLGAKVRWECQLRPPALTPTAPVFGAPSLLGTLFEETGT